jgi:protease-4
MSEQPSQTEVQSEAQAKRPDAEPAYLKDEILKEFLADRRHERRWTAYRNAALSIAVLFPILIIGGALIKKSFDGKGDQHAAVVDIKGEIAQTGLASADMVIPALRKAFENKHSTVVVLRIDSPGGSPIESERINNEVERLKKKHNKPVEVVIETLGASAAYLIAIHSDHITAGKYSLVGSIGAILGSWDVSALADKLEVKHNSYASGKFKDILDPFREPRQEERDKIMALVNSMGKTFGDEVISARKTKLKIDRPALTTGEIWTGPEALSIGLIDTIGTMDSVTDRYKVKGINYGPSQPDPLGLLKASKDIGVGFSQGVMSVLPSASRNFY